MYWQISWLVAAVSHELQDQAAQPCVALPDSRGGDNAQLEADECLHHDASTFTWLHMSPYKQR